MGHAEDGARDATERRQAPVAWRATWRACAVAGVLLLVGAGTQALFPLVAMSAALSAVPALGAGATVLAYAPLLLTRGTAGWGPVGNVSGTLSRTSSAQGSVPTPRLGDLACTFLTTKS